MSPVSRQNDGSISETRTPASPRIDFQPLVKELDLYGDELEEAAVRVIRSGWYLRGPETRLLEEELAALCAGQTGETLHCVAVSNGLDALRLMIRAYMEHGRLKAGDEVLYPANTYIASVMPLTEFGLIPVGVEPDASDFNMSLSEAEKHVSGRTRAVMLVHLYGNPAWDAAAAARLKERGILIFEDNAQAIGAEAAEEGLHGSRYTGSLGDCAAFSFYPSKNIGAMGDAGAVVTADAGIARTVRTLANYGSERRYYNILEGYNCRMDEIQAAMLRVKLRHIGEVTARRQQTAALYDRLITNPEIVKPRIHPDRSQVWHQYVIRSHDRDRLRDYLMEHGVATEIHYPVPPHLQPSMKGRTSGSFPFTERLSGEVLSLPIGYVSEEEVSRIAGLLNRFR